MSCEFFMRFYDQSTENVEECVAKIKEINPDILSHRITNATLRATPWNPSPSHEVRLVFADEETAGKMSSNKQAIEIYHSYAAPNHNTTFVNRNPGDAAYRA